MNSYSGPNHARAIEIGESKVSLRDTDRPDPKFPSLRQLRKVEAKLTRKLLKKAREIDAINACESRIRFLADRLVKLNTGDPTFQLEAEKETRKFLDGITRKS